MKKFVAVVLLVVLVAGGAGLWYVRGSAEHGVVLKTAPVERGPMSATISATGTIQPEEVIDVGAQVAGMIKSFGRDPRDPKKPVDFRTEVEEGTVLARIDDSLYVADYEQAKADLGTAQANVQSARASLESLRSKLHQTERDWARAKALNPSRSIAAVDYDTAQNAWETAKAAVPVGEAALLQAQKAVERAQANLKRAEVNLGYTVIRSPVKGTIVDRRVNIGQTVVSSLSAPSLFLLAKDLTRMQVWASVNEADIGQIHAGQDANFTVDAYPGRVFKGKVGQIRYNASMTQNVVTYTVVVDTNNDDRKLLPYLTANVQFLVSQRDNVLKVPNAALRWRPQVTQLAPEDRAEFARAQRRQAGQAGGSAAAAATGPERERHDQGTVWVKEGRFVKPVRVQVGLSDGLYTEVIDPHPDGPGVHLAEGMPVVVREMQAGGETEASNPFTPKLFSGKKQ